MLTVLVAVFVVLKKEKGTIKHTSGGQNTTQRKSGKENMTQRKNEKQDMTQRRVKLS